MRIHLVLGPSKGSEALEAVARETGAEIRSGHDIESAVEAARKGEVDAVLVPASEIARLGCGQEQISSFLRHRIMNPLATVLGYAQLLSMAGGKDPEADRKKVDAIAEGALRIRDLVNATRSEGS